MGACARTARTVILVNVPAKETEMQTQLHNTREGGKNQVSFSGGESEGNARRGE
jgi:hypothetical protein